MSEGNMSKNIEPLLPIFNFATEGGSPQARQRQYVISKQESLLRSHACKLIRKDATSAVAVAPRYNKDSIHVGMPADNERHVDIDEAQNASAFGTLRTAHDNTCRSQMSP